MKKLNQKGFSAIEIVLILVIVSLLIGVGLYILRIDKKTVPLAENAKYAYGSSEQNQKKSNKILPKEPEPPSIGKITYVSGGTDEQMVIKKRLKSFYDAWNNLSSSAQQYSKNANSVYEKYMTDNQIKQLYKEGSYNLFTCSQMKSESLTINNPTISNSKASVSINSVEIGGNPRKPIKISLVKDSSLWYLDHVSCTFE